MKVAIVSAFIDPEAVGEPRWCYDLAKGISDRVDCAIVSQTPVHGRSTVSEMFPGKEVYEAPGWKLDWLDKRMRALIKPNYLRFYRFARQTLRRPELLSAVSCGHHFGPLGMRYPTPLQGLGIPYVIGPLGGSLPLPPGFRTGATRDPWYYKMRDFDRLRFQYDPLLRAGYEEAEILVGAGHYVREVLKPINLKRFEVHSQRIARPPVADIEDVIRRRRASEGPLRLLIASRLIFSKGVQHVINALTAVDSRLPNWTLDIVGDGVYRLPLELAVKEAGLTEKVIFHGHMPRAAVDDFYRRADIFLFPTIREPSGTVTFEAMSWALPIIAVNYGGPGTHVHADFGFKAAVTSVANMERDIGDALIKLGNDPDLRETMGRRAMARGLSHHSIDEMVDFFTSLYRSIGC